jgi:hypothetical protein
VNTGTSRARTGLGMWDGSTTSPESQATKI